MGCDCSDCCILSGTPASVGKSGYALRDKSKAVGASSVGRAAPKLSSGLVVMKWLSSSESFPRPE